MFNQTIDTSLIKHDKENKSFVHFKFLKDFKIFYPNTTLIYKIPSLVALVCDDDKMYFGWLMWVIFVTPNRDKRVNVDGETTRYQLHLFYFIINCIITNLPRI